jgi:hypothetical protein
VSVATERAAVAYARPLNKLLMVLVDGRNAAARGTAVDDSGVRAAVGEVNGIDRQVADTLQVGQRWDQLAGEIDSTLGRNTSGSDALRAYAAPIALTQALLDRIASSSQVTGDPAGSYHLIDVALRRLPDVVASAGDVAALAATTEHAAGTTSTRQARADAQPDPRLAIAEDRLARTADEIGVLLRALSDRAANYVADLRLLAPLDEFAAATDELSHATARLGMPGSGARDGTDAASARVKAAALALETAVLNALDAQLTANAGEHTAQQRLLLLAGAAIALAVGALLWLRVLTPAAAHADASGDKAVGRHGFPAEAPDAGSDRPERTPNLVDARELLAIESTDARRVAATRGATGTR